MEKKFGAWCWIFFLVKCQVSSGQAHNISHISQTHRLDDMMTMVMMIWRNGWMHGSRRQKKKITTRENYYITTGT